MIHLKQKLCIAINGISCMHGYRRTTVCVSDTYDASESHAYLQVEINGYNEACNAHHTNAEIN